MIRQTTKLLDSKCCQKEKKLLCKRKDAPNVGGSDKTFCELEKLQFSNSLKDCSAKSAFLRVFERCSTRRTVALIDDESLREGENIRAKVLTVSTSSRVYDSDELYLREGLFPIIICVLSSQAFERQAAQ